MTTAKRFEDLDVWKRARALTKDIYRISGEGGFAGDRGLRDQIRRAAVSIVSNIAEGYERDGNREFVQFLYHAKGSAGEVRAQLHVAADQNYVDHPVHEHLSSCCMEISKMLSGLITYLRRSEIQGTRYNPKYRPSG